VSTYTPLAIIVITTMVTATVTALIIIMAMKGDPSTAAGRGKGLRRVTGGADGRPPIAGRPRPNSRDTSRQIDSEPILRPSKAELFTESAFCQK
jgi:hypothetical protein